MTENTNGTEITKLDGKGALWTIAGTAIGGLATSWLRGLNGGMVCTGTAQVAAQAANTAMAIEMAGKDAEIARLKSEQSTDVKLSDVFKTLRTLDKEQDAKLADVDKRVAALEVAGPLREENVRARIDSVATLATNGIAGNSAAIQHLSAVVAGLTKTVIPIDNVCPQPMPRYNAWTAPAASSGGPTPA